MGILFENISLQYDIYQQLVTTLFDSGSTVEHISIDNERITWFSFAGLKFINYKDGLLPSGIYQEFYAGRQTKILVQRVKEKVRNDEQRRLYDKFSMNHKIYLLQGDDSYPVRNKKDLMIAVGNDGNVKKYIKSNHLTFGKKNLEASLLKVMEYYDNK